ncbi:MAG: O-antigen ligase family protein [Chloroflexi bacterium]|nr:O-antigen ligase family protein [Chloroflexota bacterium]
MQTRLSRICDGVIEAGWLAALVVTPLFFNTFSNRVFEPDKLHLLRSIALVMAAVWIIQLLDVGLGRASKEGGLWAHMRRTPLVLPALILVVAYLVSTALSVTPRISFLGSYVRMQGTFTFLSYVAVFAMMLTHLRTRSQVNRLIYTVVISSLPISIYAIIQHVGLDPLPWGGDVKERVAANMGNAIFVAAYLIIAVFLTLERLIESVASLLSEEQGSTADALRAGAYLFILAVQMIAIVFTQSRGPWLGLAAGFYVFLMLGLLLLGRWVTGQRRAPRWLRSVVRPAWLFLLGLTIVVLVFIGTLNVPQGPFSTNLCQQRYIGRVCTLTSLSEGTNAVRVLIWEGAVDMMLKPHAAIEYPDGSPDTLNAIRPLIGYGPESMWVAYNSFYPPDLAHYEARNASPDRSHNETFDALVRTGLVGLLAQLFLYGSVFYYALRWLGLMQGRGRRNLFLALLIGGAILGVIIPWVADHSLRLAGLGLPVGLILGMMLYVTVDLLLTPAVARSETGESEQGGAEARSKTGQSERGGALAGGRRQLLILALLSAIVAHFVEVHFGIAIASTLTHFWALAALLVVVGMGWVDREEQPELAPAPTAVSAGAKTHAAAARTPKAAAPRSTPPASGRKGGPVSPAHARADRRAEDHRRHDGAGSRVSSVASRPSMETPIRSSVSSAAHPLLSLLPYAGVGALITLVLTWDYLVNQTGAQDALSVLWNAFTLRVDNNAFRVVQSPMLLVLLIFTWVVGALLAAAELYRQRPAGRSFPWIGAAGVYLGATAGVFFIFGLILAGRVNLANLKGMEVFHRIAGHVVVFDVALLLLLLATGAALWLADSRPRPFRWWGELGGVAVGGGVVALILALLIIVNVNIRTVQADTYYKQGLAYEGAGAWESAVILYREAANLQPEEDFYYLFIGRGLLQFASTASVATPTLPADLSKVATSDLLTLVERGLRARDREDLMRASYAALLAAQRLNPLNTDHSANLARLHRSWAFNNALGPNDVPSNDNLRQIVATRPKDVDLAKLDLSLDYYRQATSLSPQNAQLWNELASVQFVKGDTDAAFKTLDHSVTVDQQYYQTYVLRGDMAAAIGDRAAALNAYRKATEYARDDVGVLSAVGVYSAQTGDSEGALTAFRHIIELQTATLNSSQSQLAALEAQARRAGGYAVLLSSAASRRDALTGAITSQKSQLHVSYRNTALILRDAGRIPEALDAAAKAQSLASDAEKPTIEALIADLQKRVTP